YLENQRMFLERNGYPEETFFTFSLSPIRDESGKVVGLFHPVTETTPSMLTQRRVRALRDIAEKSSHAKTVAEAASVAIGSLAAYALDLPLALLFLQDGDSIRLAAKTGAYGPHDSLLTPDAWPWRQAVVALRMSDL